jgi:hypothetical protein
MRRIKLLPFLVLTFAPPAVAQPPPPAEPQPPAQPGAPASEPPPERVSVGMRGFLQPSVLLQGWFCASSGEGFWPMACRNREGSQDEWQTTFRIRRAELRVTGQIVPDRIGYAVMIDPAKVFETSEVEKPVEGGTGTVSVLEPPRVVSVFQDFYITLLSEYADVSLGQLKLPLSWEGYNSSSSLLFPERALSSREYGDQRDIGLRVEKKLGPVYYQAGLFNGTGPNRADDDDQKDAALRVELFPLDWLMIGAVGYTSIGEREKPTTRDALEADLRVELMSAVVQAEYIRNWEGSSQDERVQGHGAYLAGGYTVLDRYQPVVRVGVLDSDVARKDDHVWHYEAGFNYYLEQNEAKLQASYGLFDPADGSSRHELVVSAQLSF